MSEPKDRRRHDFAFEVFDEDESNQRWMDYRRVILNALLFYHGSSSPKEHELIDHLLYDGHRKEPTTYDEDGCATSVPDIESLEQF